MGQLRGAIVTQWNNLYPGVPFPHPKDHPQMFPENFVIKKSNYTYNYSWWDDLWGDCCAFSRCCSKGLIDYQCQFNNNCYLNLATLAINVIGFMLVCIVFTILFGYAWKLSYKFIVSAAFITKFMAFMSGMLKCFTFGMFNQNVYYKTKQVKGSYTQEQLKIIQKAQQLQIKVVISRLDDYQKKRILEVLEDYQQMQHGIYLCFNRQQSDSKK